ncbi:glutaredoxin family protein [Marinobacter confluentis]|uniref:Glutaredoxin n=1 Tax=Marinobacter confluentis TaxID=1697557 RepID=A0A4Z1BPD5_9GAMM|nr:glutaredoxin [Marinobacter confluentis]TGN41837.1 glutaredoxin [Marinobacter confluentis]
MNIVMRYFFRFLRLVLTPVILVMEKFTTPKAMARSAEDQAAIDSACKDLALYQFQACPFCVKVRKEIARLGLNIEYRDARNNPYHRAELEEGGGRIKVPCLRVTQSDGKQEWLYESSAINQWLRERFDPSVEDAANA